MHVHYEVLSLPRFQDSEYGQQYMFVIMRCIVCHTLAYWFQERRILCNNHISTYTHCGAVVAQTAVDNKPTQYLSMS